MLVLMCQFRHARVSVMRATNLQQAGMCEALCQREQPQPKQTASQNGSDAWTEEAVHGWGG